MLSMKVQRAVRAIQIREWSHQIQECQDSGMSISRWCAENGINTKTYYYRRKRVREELLDGLEIDVTSQLSNLPPDQLATPVFASLPMPRNSSTAMTIQIGPYVAEIHNGADTETVEGVLRALFRL
jgi:transposase-like protein